QEQTRPEVALEREARPLRWVRSAAELEAAVEDMRAESVVGLDVETTLERSLCLIQMAGTSQTWLIDALEVGDLAPLARVLASPTIVKVIHHAAFEREVLGQHGLGLEAVFDTCEESRARRPGIEGLSLQAVCERELGVWLEKREQTSDWSKRPLSESQVAYAALDAEVLLVLHAHFVSGAEPRARRENA
ncbi:MAG TPA: ribonuclease D, partial [Myxococcota bacterium]|nr:ribonuclease D [Myxococcota bacterium]